MGRTDWGENCDVIRKCGGDSLGEKRVKMYEMKTMIKEGACD